MFIKGKLLCTGDTTIPVVINMEQIKRVEVDTYQEEGSKYNNQLILVFIESQRNPKTGADESFYVMGDDKSLIAKLEEIGLLIKK